MGIPFNHRNWWVFFFEILTKPKRFTQKHDVITIACLLFYSIFQCLTWWAVAFFFFLDMVDWPISSFSTNYKPYHEFHLFHFSKTCLKNPHQHDCYPNLLQIDTSQIIIHPSWFGMSTSVKESYMYIFLLDISSFVLLNQHFSYLYTESTMVVWVSRLYR